MKFPLYLFVFFVFYIIGFKVYKEMQKISCYKKCSNFHIYGEADNWIYHDFIVYDNDTTWIDKECYNEWCICIDECNPGQCCKKLNTIYN